MLSALDHLVIYVDDLPRAVDFYSRVLGMDAKEQDAGHADLHLGTLTLRLQHPDSPATPRAAAPAIGGMELSFSSRLPLDEVERHLAALSVPVELGPVAREGGKGPVDSLYLRDPEGNLLEINRPRR
ncbi:VOC family protein [Halomonas sp. YLGW01]|uniref:VOC family protein n=1 Tax=Halomonas sp. YLGW01 TaxID=2773308 RepID=UPI001784E9B0|nr:VOC family protein [Halomonas sp. YLGW01]